MHRLGMSTMVENIKKVIYMDDPIPPNVVIRGSKCVNIVKFKEDEFEPLFKELAVEV